MTHKTTWIKARNVLLSNIGLKIGSVIIAILIWFFVVNVENPETTQTYTTKVTITNANVLTEQGKYYQVVGSQTVSFRVTAKRTVQQKLTNSDFTATADMNYLGDNNEIPISITAKNYSSSISISATPHYLKVSVGTLKNSKFTVDARTTGTPASGYVISDVTSDPEVITVEGPKSIVSQIETVTATANVDGISADQEISAVPKFYDKNGKTVDTSQLTVSVNTVNLQVKVKNSKTVPINVQTSGTLPANLELDSISSDPKEVTIAGDKDVLNGISEVTIPSDVVNLSDITDDWETTVDLTSYLPEDVTLVDTSEKQVTIQVSLKKEGSQTFDVPTANLSIQNLGTGLTGSFTSNTVSVTINGLKSDLAGISAASLTGSVDASGLTAGKHEVVVTLNLGTGLTASTASTELEIQSQTTDNNGSAGNTGTTGTSGTSSNSNN